MKISYEAITISLGDKFYLKTIFTVYYTYLDKLVKKNIMKYLNKQSFNNVSERNFQQQEWNKVKSWDVQ